MDIKALYEIKRQNFLIGYIQNPDRFDDALAYAHEHRMAPIFHGSNDEDPFSDAYEISAEFAMKVVKYIDGLWLEKKFDKLGFYDLEDQFGGHHEYRSELICILEYARISRRFDDALYQAVEANAPVEGNSIDSSFGPEDVYFG